MPYSLPKPKVFFLGMFFACCGALGNAHSANIAANELAAPAKNECTVEIRVTDAAGNPIEGTVVILTPPPRFTEYLIKGGNLSDDKSLFTVRIEDSIGLYILSAIAPGHKVAEFPIIANGKVKKIPDIVLPKTDDPPSVAISSDNKTVKWASIWGEYVSRKRKSDASFRQRITSDPVFRLNNLNVVDMGVSYINWGSDLLDLSREIGREKDKETRAFLSACYLELGKDGIAQQPAAVNQALRSLDEANPFWSLTPQMPFFALKKVGEMPGRAQPEAAIMMFLSRIEKKHPDPEVRAFALLRRVEEMDQKGGALERKKLGQLLVKEYPETSAAHYVKARFPYDFQ